MDDRDIGLRQESVVAVENSDKDALPGAEEKGLPRKGTVHATSREKVGAGPTKGEVGALSGVRARPSHGTMGRLLGCMKLHFGIWVSSQGWGERPREESHRVSENVQSPFSPYTSTEAR